MTLRQGTHLGPYEIIGAIGAGGMGEVYKARDARLNRVIAIKLLPAAASLDGERRMRFEREAQAIAALNHPNIVTIFSVEEARGADGDLTLFLTMELVEGISLAEAMPRGGLPLDRLLRIAIPVAAAISAAHQKGITHRDLKPANVMLGDGEHAGRVKVLDFGLAKLAARPIEADALTSPPLGFDTGVGQILGTVAYMSPEQAEGKATDARSDLFSLGIILYEMATGRRPFTGETPISVISSIVKDTPKPVTEHKQRPAARTPPNHSPSARQGSRASLPDGERSGERPAGIERLHRFGRRCGPRPRPDSRVAGRDMARHSRHCGRHLAGRCRSASRIPLSSPAAPAAAPTFQMLPLTISGNAQLPALSPDAKYLAYRQIDRDQHSVWVRQVDSNSDLQIVPPVAGQAVLGLTVTPTGGFVDFVTRRGNDTPQLWRVPMLGGPSRTERSCRPRDRDHQRRHRSGECRACAGQPRLVPGHGHRPRVRHRSLVLNLMQAGGPPQLVSVRTPSGEITRLTNDLHGYAGVSAAADVIASAQYETRSSLWIADATGRGARQIGRDVPSELARWGLAWAGDDHVVYDAALVGGRGLWSIDVKSGSSRFLIPDAGMPSTSAARQTLVFSRGTTSEGWAVWRADIDGGHPAKVPNAVGFCPSMTPDGSAVLFLSLQSGVQTAWIVDLANGDNARPFSPVWVNACGIAVSPDGRSVVLQSRTDDGAPEAHIVPVTGGEPVRRVAIGGGSIQWTPDGRSLAFIPRDAPSNVWIQSLAGGPARPLTQFADQRVIAYGWSGDGRRLAIARGADRSDIVLLKLKGAR